MGIIESYNLSSSNKLILYPTDDVRASRNWARALNQANIGVFITTYSEALTFAPDFASFHQIIIDHYGDPDLVYPLCRGLRSQFSLPILLVTHATNERFHLQAYELGVEECISKPIGKPLFTTKVLSWLRQVGVS